MHHVAFVVEDRAAQLEVRKALTDTGWQVTPPIDRDYSWAIYFRTLVGCCLRWRRTSPASTGTRTPPISARR